MGKERSLLTLCAIVLSLAAGVAVAQKVETERLFSPLTAEMFHRTANRIYAVNPSDEESAQVARIFLEAALQLDHRADYLYEDVLVMGSTSREEEDFDKVFNAFRKYVSEKSDFEVLRKAVRFLLSAADSRQDREQMLMRLFNISRRDNAVLASELATELGQLAVEKGDAESAKANYAEAYNYNNYNMLAFEKYNELLIKEGMVLGPAAYAMDLRFAMDINPLDIDTVYAFADYCENAGAYSVAAEAYEYTAAMFKYLSPQEALPPSIYLPWAMNSYNTPMLESKCLDIARQVRASARFDIRIEALAAGAARKMGNADLSEEILEKAGQNAEDMLRSSTVAGDITPVELAWFYAFASPNRERALAWGNRAFTAEPDKPGVKSMFGYVLAMNEQYELAETYAAEAETDQVALIALAMVQLSADEKGKAVETLNKAVAADPLSFAAEKAKSLLADNGWEYTAPESAATVAEELKKEFGERVVPLFRPAKDLFSAKLNLSGSEFSYGGDINAQLIITNNSSNTMVISDESIFAGNIRIDAEVSGDIKRKFPGLITKKVVPSRPIKPGDYVSVALDMKAGPLGKLLAAFPQASVEVEFVAYLDPVIGTDGAVKNLIKEIEPIRNTIKRRRVELTRQYLMQRLDVLASGQEGQKIRAGQLFLGLLIEQDFMSKSKPMYRYVRVERPLLVDAVKRSVADENWKVRLHTLEGLTLFAGQLDLETTSAVSGSINDSYWPVRMTAMYLLSKSETEGFQRVLDWSAKSDSEKLVRNMAFALSKRDAAQGPSGKQK